ncbi:hypothetical protein DSCO28_17180 [Desulfosarcina ovata subsp. sediminis]|uniref:Uncharacterized protein n=1 Tax=Desulfosarcina ovata subsp. sediminis TaxID=885957 RepID=A0A5K7ZGD6_9BACT|nr:hypothetical protein DSCO28_17180 [Desulfosarcina ovata subsp. sediminis]
MTDAVCALERNGQTAFSRPRLKRFGDGSGFENTIWRSTPKEDLSARQSGTTPLKIVNEARANLVGQGQDQVVSAFMLRDTNQARSPLYIIKCQRYDFA